MSAVFNRDQTKRFFLRHYDLNRSHYLEGQSGPDLVRQHFSNHPIKSPQDLHCQLGFDASFVDQIVERISERQPEADSSLS
jgi:hypothetical protein